MARKKKESLFEIIIDLASNISWKLSVPMAILSYVAFNYAANLPMPTGTDLHSITNSIPQQLFIIISKFLQYLIPAAFIIGAGLSIYKGQKRGALLEQQSGIDSIREMSWQDFELLVGEAFRRKGYSVKENGGGGADGGIDLILTKAAQRTVVQCKRWKSSSVNVQLVRELYGIMVAERATACIFVSSGSYTADAKSFAKGKPIQLIDGEDLYELINTVQTPGSVKVTITPNLTKPTFQTAALKCPLCGAEMIKRIAKKGANAGNTFWGCSKYPSCRGTVN